MDLGKARAKEEENFQLCRSISIHFGDCEVFSGFLSFLFPFALALCHSPGKSVKSLIRTRENSSNFPRPITTLNQAGFSRHLSLSRGKERIKGEKNSAMTA